MGGHERYLIEIAELSDSRAVCLYADLLVMAQESGGSSSCRDAIARMLERSLHEGEE